MKLEWKPDTTRYVVDTRSATGEVRVKAQVYTDGESCGWTVVGRSGQFSCSGVADDIEEAQKAAERVLGLVDQLVELRVYSTVWEKPTDQIDMVDPTLERCLLCDLPASRCLHDASEVRAAFRLALRLGKHVPDGVR